ncbi:MAG TPA: hypothetical protein VNJ08_15065 [Bacteriovoracaceae bacterium]|nr:hypothetical protein [Bacteriovoracaceae bacterium]
MKESIQRPGSEVAIVIYDAPLPPKYFRLNKKFLRTLFFAVPIALTMVFGALFFWGLGSRLYESPRPTFSTVMTETETKIAALETELKGVKDSNERLTEKLATQSPANTNEDPFLMAIKKPYGMQNLLNKNLVNADHFAFVQEAGRVSLKFDIISTTAENRVTGHVLVFMISAAGTMAYPAEANNSLSEGIKYTLGEPFAVARLRPTTAVFQHQLTGDSVKFVVYIFSREGDLLMIKETQRFQNGNKK